MATLDQELVFSDGQDIGQAVGTYESTNAFDRKNANGDLGVGVRRGFVEFRIDEAVTTGSTSAVQFQIVHADNAALDSSPVVLAETDAIDSGTLVAGYKTRLAMPDGITKRYLGVRYVISGATTTAGTADAYYLDVPDNQEQYFGNNGV